MGGCFSSHSAASEDEQIVTVKNQRRRLSVAPTQVGDITINNNGPKNPPSSPATVVHEGKFGVFTHVSATKQGYVPHNAGKVNQDRAIEEMNLCNDPGLHLLGILDGHGEVGHHVSQWIQDNIRSFFEKEGAQKLRAQPNNAIGRAVASLCADLKGTDIKLSFSGTTAVFVLFVDNVIHVANIGDSRCIVGSDNGNGVVPVVLSEDHKPDLPQERDRILAAGGRVHTLPGPPGEDCGPHRVWLKQHDIPGLAMSRSIGDAVSHTVGVIDEPEFTIHALKKTDKFAVIASDGVWEFLSNSEVVDLVEENIGDLNGAAKALIAESVKRWKQREHVIDDITCIIARFHL